MRVNYVVLNSLVIAAFKAIPFLLMSNLTLQDCTLRLIKVMYFFETDCTERKPQSHHKSRFQEDGKGNVVDEYGNEPVEMSIHDAQLPPYDVINFNTLLNLKPLERSEEKTNTTQADDIVHQDFSQNVHTPDRMMKRKSSFIGEEENLILCQLKMVDIRESHPVLRFQWVKW
ncbi:hypothetical protein EDC96DRAFT_549171 [Choanephora cucurbitarum]|nr:hypothetical protein EDC96DRAFT_549171 [Choanephora cucurbitarum]